MSCNDTLVTHATLPPLYRRSCCQTPRWATQARWPVRHSSHGGRIHMAWVVVFPFVSPHLGGGAGKRKIINVFMLHFTCNNFPISWVCYLQKTFVCNNCLLFVCPRFIMHILTTNVWSSPMHSIARTMRITKTGRTRLARQWARTIARRCRPSQWTRASCAVNAPATWPTTWGTWNASTASLYRIRRRRIFRS